MNRFFVLTMIVAVALLSLGFITSMLTGNNTTDSPNHPIVSNGKWEFYWNKLLDPNDFDHLEQQPSYMMVPSSWKSQSLNGNSLSPFGFGTYRTQFTIPVTDVGTEQALSLHYVGSAYRIWINGEEFEGLGKVGTSKDSEIPQLRKNIIRFSPQDETIEIVMQVSNFSFREGGIVSDIHYGNAHTLSRSMLLSTYITVFEIGATFLFGAYHLVLFYLRRSDIALLYIGLISILYAMRTLLIAEYVVNIFLPHLPWEIIIRAEYLIELTMALLIGFFLRYMFPMDVGKTLFRILVICTSLSLVYVALTPTEVFTSLIHAAIVVALLFIVIIDITIKVKIRNREDANLYLFGVTFLIVAVSNDTLNYMLILDTFYMIKYAFMTFIFIQALIISNRYQRLYEHNANLTKELTLLNNSLEEKIDLRTAELRAKNKELEQLQIKKTEMLANIAHDIGTPLAGVRTYMHILKEDKIKTDKSRLFNEMIDQLSYIQRLNHDLLELSKLESKQLTFLTEEVQVGPFLRDLLASLHIDFPFENTKLQLGEVHTEWNGQEVCMEVDRVRILQVMQNFISNAIKYNDRQEKIIIIHCHIRNSTEAVEKIEAVFEIEDNGNGISEAEIPYIFDQFYRKVEGNVEGSGLGLAIVKGIIEQHGGQVGARTKTSAGSIFYFTLPAVLKVQSPQPDF